MIEASSPAKAILFGEHAVVYGKPAIAIALDRRISVSIKESNRTTVDGKGLAQRRNRYVRWAIENLWEGPPLEIRTRSHIPSASGLGSSAALSCSVAGALREYSKRFDPAGVASDAFEMEYNVQGGASPTDTSCSAHGGGILVSFEKGDDHLWSLGKKEKLWHIHDVEPPNMSLVVGYTKKPSITHIQVGKVRGFYERSGFAKETVQEIGDLVTDAYKAIMDGDMVRIGELMTRNHSLLTILGASSKELQKLVEAASPHSFGAKMTGAGGGGSMIALTDNVEKVSDAISARGGVPYVVNLSMIGTETHSSTYEVE